MNLKCTHCLGTQYTIWLIPCALDNYNLKCEL